MDTTLKAHVEDFDGVVDEVAAIHVKKIGTELAAADLPIVISALALLCVELRERIATLEGNR